MKSKKIIFCIAIIAILLVGGITLKMSSKDSSSSETQSNTTTETPSNSVAEKPADSSAETPNDSTTASKDDENTNNAASTGTDSNGNNADKNTNSQGSVNANFSSQDAAANILKFYLGEEDISSQHLTAISLEGNVAKKQDNSNTYYSNTKEFSDDTDKGLIIILDNYDESAKTYKYTLKDYFSLRNGTDTALDTGTVASDGTVKEES